MVLGVKNNFAKSNVFGLNLDDFLLEAAPTFVACCVNSILFKFLGLLVGENTRRCSTWQSIADMVKKPLTWKGKYIFLLGGLVSLILC